MVEPATTGAPTSLWRVGRASSPVHFSAIDPVDAAVATAGNRFDVPGGEVLYAASKPSGAFAETIARMRPTARMQALSMDGDFGYMTVGSVPAEWRMQRRLVEVHLDEPAPFLDVDAAATHTFLTEKMAPVLTAMGIDNLDVSHVRGSNRLLTRAIAQFAYVQQDSEGRLAFSGIRYESKVGTHECWAVFGGTEFSEGRKISIEKADPDLTRVAKDFGLTIH